MRETCARVLAAALMTGAVAAALAMPALFDSARGVGHGLTAPPSSLERLVPAQTLAAPSHRARARRLGVAHRVRKPVASAAAVRETAGTTAVPTPKTARRPSTHPTPKPPPPPTETTRELSSTTPTEPAPAPAQPAAAPASETDTSTCKSRGQGKGNGRCKEMHPATPPAAPAPSPATQPAAPSPPAETDDQSGEATDHGQGNGNGNGNGPGKDHGDRKD